MKLNKSLILIFSICIALLLSLSAVSAADLTNNDNSALANTEDIEISDLEDSIYNADTAVSEEISDYEMENINLNDDWCIVTSLVVF